MRSMDLFSILVIFVITLVCVSGCKQDMPSPAEEASSSGRQTGIKMPGPDRTGADAYLRKPDASIRYLRCSDSDSGLDYGAQGTVEVEFISRNGTGNQYAALADHCEPGYLIEYFCQGRRSAKEAYACPDGCEQGACVSEPIRPDGAPYFFLAIHHSPNTANPAGFRQLRELVDLADRYGIKIAFLFNPQWIDMILADNYLLDTVHSWQENGHEIGIEHHGPSHMQWNGYTNLPVDIAVNISYIRASKDAYIHEYLGPVDGPQGYIVRAAQLAYPHEIKTGTFTDKWTDFAQGVPYEIEGSGDGRTISVISNIWNSEPRFRLNIQAITRIEDLPLAIRYYDTLNASGIFGIVTHSHNYPANAQALEALFTHIAQRDPDGAKQKTPAWIMENHVFQNDLVVPGSCGDGLCNDVERFTNTCPHDCDTCVFPTDCGWCTDPADCPQCQGLRVCESWLRQ